MTMELIRQNGPDCLITSAAMCLGVQPQMIMDYLQTDGHEIWWPPSKMRGIHIQEIIDFAMTMGKTFFPIELKPMIAHDEHVEPRPIYNDNQSADRFLSCLHGRVGVLVTLGHACAWDGSGVLDPKGFRGSLKDYKIHEVWLLADYPSLSD